MITGVVLARNEERNIVNCLRALERHVSEIILIDMESSDQTVELAKPYVDKLLAHPLVNNFDSARNIAIPEATHDWLWFVDADEWITDEIGNLVNDLIRRQGDEFEAINIPFKSYFCGHWMQYCGWWPGYTCPRVLKRGRFEFSRTLHGGVRHNGREILFPADPRYGVPHHSFRSIEHWIEKANRYTTTEALQLAERGFSWDWRYAVHMMVHDWWEHYEKHAAKLDGDRGWILTWLASQYRWLSVAKLIDVADPAPSPDSSISVPDNLDEVLLAFEQELAVFRKRSVSPPLGIVWRSEIWGSSARACIAREMTVALSEQERRLSIDPIGLCDEPVAHIGSREAALLRALVHCRRARHVVTVTLTDDLASKPDPYAAFNVLMTAVPADDSADETSAIDDSFDEIWVGSEQESDALRRLGAAPERLRVVGSWGRIQEVANEDWRQAVESMARPVGEDISTAVAEIEARISPEMPANDVEGRVAVEIEGEFLAGHSFSNINEAMALGFLSDPRFSLVLNRRQNFSLAEVPADERRRLLPYFSRRLPEPAPIVIRHSYPPNWNRLLSGQTWVHIQPWEFGFLPADWIEPLRDWVDEIWVPSRFVRNVYVNSGIPEEKLHYVPWGVDLQCFSPSVPARRLPTEKTFRFLYVGGTIPRKGFDRVLEAYLSEFTRDDDVSLVIKDMGAKTYYPGNLRNEVLAVIDDPQTPEIIYLDSEMTSGQLSSLYAACDCLVAPYRGEGFCLPVLEAMACGLPVIVPRGGPTDDFVDDQAAIRLESIAVRRSFPDAIATANGFTELEVDVSDVRAAMRSMVTEDPRHLELRKERARALAEQFPWSTTIDAMATRIITLTQHRAIPLPQSPRVEPIESDDDRTEHTSTRPTTIAACILTQNHEHEIASCLSHIRPYVDDIVVADLGSVDRSVDIAREYGAQVVSLNCDDEEAALAECCRSVDSEWVICLKVSDRVGDGTAATIAELLRQQLDSVCEVEIGTADGTQATEDTSQRPLTIQRRLAVLDRLDESLVS